MDVMGQELALFPYPNITAWQCCNTILPVHGIHDVKLRSLGSSIAGWSIRHLYTFASCPLQTANSCLETVQCTNNRQMLEGGRPLQLRGPAS